MLDQAPFVAPAAPVPPSTEWISAPDLWEAIVADPLVSEEDREFFRKLCGVTPAPDADRLN